LIDSGVMAIASCEECHETCRGARFGRIIPGFNWLLCQTFQLFSRPFNCFFAKPSMFPVEMPKKWPVTFTLLPLMSDSYGLATSEDLSGTDTCLFILFQGPHCARSFGWFKSQAPGSCLRNFVGLSVKGVEIAIFPQGSQVAISETDSIIQSLRNGPDDDRWRFVVEVRKMDATPRHFPLPIARKRKGELDVPR
jgi:hypothetical protein